jgi:colanic acid biosynthesis glycosyl transferase WcaI
MHLVFLNQYYPPDAAPTGVMLQAVVEQLAADNHTVTVICAAGGYAGAEGIVEEGALPAGVMVRRIGATRFGRGTFVGKLLDYFTGYLGMAWRLLTMHPKPERVVALTTPPYLSVLARALSKLRGADHAHWVMDLYPDVMAAHGMLASRSFPYRLLSRLAGWGFGGKRCAAVLTLGPDMAERVDSLRRANGKPTEWVPLWASSETEDATREALELRRSRGWADDEMVVMYSGNMGLGHRFQEILSVATAFQPSAEGAGGVRLVFFGRGKRRAEIDEFMAQESTGRVELHDYAPAKILTAHLQSADVHLVSLDPSWSGTMVPSKLQGIFTIGRPVVFIGSAQSSIGRWVIESQGGWQVEADDVAGLRGVLRQAADPAERMRRGQAAARFADLHFRRAANAKRVADVFAASR